jgi:hypothetical protein
LLNSFSKGYSPLNTKFCYKCQTIKEVTFFYKNKNTKDGLKHICINCCKAEYKSNKDKRKEYSECYYLKHKEKIQAASKKWKTNNKAHRKQRDREWTIKNKEHLKQKNKNWYIKNQEEASQRQKEYNKQNKAHRQEINRNWYLNNKDKIRQYSNKPEVRLRHHLRSRLYSALHGSKRNGSAVDNLGCTIDELRQYLESKFLPGMSWDNWGRTNDLYKTWHIDHIVPLSSFDLTDLEQLNKACHYTNLQPLWSEDNLSKGNTIKRIQPIEYKE